tara:strand:- start:96 stop:374 length:279 start_codon:yes stop_codon:yes gene_type:complete
MAFGGVHPFMLKKAAAASGDLFSVTPCLGGAAVLCEDTGSLAPSVSDVVTYGDLSNTYCGTIAATGQGGSAVYDLVDDGYLDCDDCALSLGP